MPGSGGLLRRPGSTALTGVGRTAVWRHAPAQARAHFRDVTFRGMHQVGTLLQVARIFGRLAVHQARMRGRDEKLRLAGLREFPDQRLHRLGELQKPMASSIDLARVLGRERLVIGEKIARLREIGFRLLVVTAMNGVVRPLEQAVFAVLDEFERRSPCPCRTNFPARAAGTTTDAVMSSSICTFTAG